MPVKHIQLPIGKEDILKLNLGDEVTISGKLITARDTAHKYMVETWPDWVEPLLKDGAIYHCGPVVRQTEAGYQALSAGPTTSIREEPYAHQIIARYGPRIIIGKGGMGRTTLNALQTHGAVYVHAIGGAASVIAQTVARVNNVHMLAEFGAPEAFWELEVSQFSGVVTMDAHGRSLHDDILQASGEKLNALL
jgi:fumarate hydratase subunit beta